MTIIENDYLRLTAQVKGAELTSIFDKERKIEYLWQADTKHWGRHAPVLFPIVGRLQENSFSYNGNSYSMNQHGIARDMNFQVLETTENSVLFCLKSKGKTLKLFPFHFNLRIRYTLEEKTVKVTYEVVNPFLEPLYFSVGGHPAFNCPLGEGEKRSDYQLVFDEKETVSTQELTDGLRNGTTREILNQADSLPLTNDLFDNDALIFNDLKSSSVTLQKGDEKKWTFHFEGFPYLGIWSKSSESPFVCIEPWFGIADSTAHNQDFKEKEGIIKLEPSKIFDCNYSIEIH